MPATMQSKNNMEAAIWARIIHPQGKIPLRTARAILKLAFADEERARMRELAAKARAGRLTAEEEMEIDGFERVGHLLSTLKSQARQALRTNPTRGSKG